MPNQAEAGEGKPRFVLKARKRSVEDGSNAFLEDEDESEEEDDDDDDNNAHRRYANQA